MQDFLVGLVMLIVLDATGPRSQPTRQRRDGACTTSRQASFVATRQRSSLIVPNISLNSEKCKTHFLNIFYILID